MNYDAGKSKRQRPLLMGIDPGFSGAISVIEIDTMKLIDMIDMPVYFTKSKARKSGEMVHLDVHVLSSSVDFYGPLTALAVIEDVGSMPGQGLSSTFRFGQVFGQIHGVMAGHYIPTYPVKPFVWKSALNLDFHKEGSREMASKVFPDERSLWDLKKHTDRAEAALIGYHGVKNLKWFYEVLKP